MALIPRMMRPSVLIRRKAMSDGFMGPSRFWKVVGVAVFGRSTIKKFLGKRPEVIDRSSLGSGRYMQIVTAKPLTRRERNKFRDAGVEPLSLSEQRQLGKLLARSTVRSRRAS